MYKFINEEENPKRITSVEIKDDGLTIWQVKDLFIEQKQMVEFRPYFF